MPLPFVGKQYLQEVNSTTRTYIESKYAYANGTVAAITADGQKPTGSTWAMNPLPDATQAGSIGAYSKEWEFQPPCKSNRHIYPFLPILFCNFFFFFFLSSENAATTNSKSQLLYLVPNFKLCCACALSLFKLAPRPPPLFRSLSLHY